ncbi:hypothetical protein G7Y89_g79 [Cudoniella acicularis]|uniref:Peptidase S33 tripeptidyl aminopeptidase-like C-terminal domain-containing protein n=1 Tax=Cudoniella acicularis TaxID=354080 RepID=A0A8H4RXV0_9HELO|nr:hypothetical protein G7Y89_g79 [Cudoniella acicularis]
MFSSTPFIIGVYAPLIAAVALPEFSLGPIQRRDGQNQTIDQATFSQITPTEDLQWTPCGDGFFCHVLDVPLDYDNPNGTRAYVPMLKYPGSTTPSKGMVMLNPGGPGGSAIDFLSGAAETLAPIVGFNYDLVAWEPRGIGYSLPNTNCTLSVLQSQNSTVLGKRWEKIEGPGVGNGTFEAVYAQSLAQGEVCEKLTGGPDQAGPHMSTGVVVRDMLNILDKYAASPYSQGVEDAEKLNFWGFSYGTIVGQTFAMMAPGRVGRVVIDGVVDPDDYYQGLELNNLQDTDAAVSTFFVYCHLAGSNLCPFNTGTSAYDIYLRFEAILARLDTKTSLEQGWDNATLISATLSQLKGYIFEQAYSPIKSFPPLAQVLVQAEQTVANITEASVAALIAAAGINPTAIKPGDEWLTAVACTDNAGIQYGKTLEELEPIQQAMQGQSYMGGQGNNNNRIGCATWPIKGVGMYGGPFGGPTSNPILFAGNTRDPITPLQNALKGARIFQDAEAITVDGTGHATFYVQNTCANNKINAYFQNGTMPGTDNFCKLEVGPFNITIPGGNIEKYEEWDTIKAKMAENDIQEQLAFIISLISTLELVCGVLGVNLNAICADVADGESQRTKIFAYTQSASQIVQFLGLALSPTAMKQSLWLPFWLGIGFFVLIYPNIVILPETRHLSGIGQQAQPAAESESLLHHTGKDESVPISQPLENGNADLPQELTRATLNTLILHLSKRYNTIFATVGYVLSLKSFVSFVLFIAIIPGLLSYLILWKKLSATSANPIGLKISSRMRYVALRTEAFAEEDGDLAFSHTKVTLREGEQYYYAITSRRYRSTSEVDLFELDLMPIPTSQIRPLFPTHFTRAPEPLP